MLFHTLIKSMAYTVSGYLIVYGLYEIIHGQKWLVTRDAVETHIVYEPNSAGFIPLISGGLIAGGLLMRELRQAWRSRIRRWIKELA
jgi:hypothetical protein